ncbi:MAG: hypothetical protein V3V55_02750, partial [Rhodospirillales bacterium]
MIEPTSWDRSITIRSTTIKLEQTLQIDGKPLAIHQCGFALYYQFPSALAKRRRIFYFAGGFFILNEMSS